MSIQIKPLLQYFYMVVFGLSAFFKMKFGNFVELCLGPLLGVEEIRTYHSLRSVQTAGQVGGPRGWGGWGWGGTPIQKWGGMLVASLWGVNCRFWSHLGCLGWKVTIFVHSGNA